MHLHKTGKKLLSLILILLSASIVTLLAACGTQPGNNGSSVTNLPTDNTPQLTSARLKHSPGGTADLSWDSQSHKLTVKISLIGLAPKSSHAAHIHAGACAADGSIVYPLNPVVADDKGDATTKTTIEDVRGGIPTNGWYINIHNGLGMTPIEHMPISCGNIFNSNTMAGATQSVHVMMEGSTAPNESASGEAEPTVVNGKLAGLQPNSTHIAHIHAGKCAAQGPVLVMLNPVVADAQGEGVSVTPLDRVPSSPKGLYVNVHMGATMADLSQPVFFNPIACGDMGVS
jgi:hypothetical protein